MTKKQTATQPETGKFRTQINSCVMEKNYEKNDLPSLTLPDQTMSIPEIMARYAKGLSLGAQKTPIYEGEDDPGEGVDPRTLDISERLDMAKQFHQELRELKKKYAKKAPPPPPPPQEKKPETPPPGDGVPPDQPLAP